MAETTKKKPGRNPKATADKPVAEAKEPETNREVEELKALVLRLQQQLAEQKPHVVQVMADTERVTMRFQADVADDNVSTFGPDGMYGQVTGASGIVTVPKSEWSRFYTESVRAMIARRWLIVISGMTDEEREMYGCAYKSGEVMDEMAFHRMLDMGRELLAVFPALCESHKEMIASKFISAWENGDDRAKDRELIVALNEMSKEDYKNAEKNDMRRKGLFWPIIDAMNAKDAE